jgi:hypothetical protein
MTEEQKQKMKEGREKARAEKEQLKKENPILEDVRPGQIIPSTDKVLIEKSFLEDIRKTMDELKSDNAMLKQVADKSRMSDFYARNKDRLPEQYKLRMIEVEENGIKKKKIILGWKMIKDDVYIDGPRVIENQVVMLVLEDGTQRELSYRDFVRLYETTICSKIGERSDENGLIVKLQRNDNQKVYECGIQFVN